MKLPINKLVNNTGQIEGVPANPRQINKDDYQKLITSLQEDSEFMEHKPLHVYKQGEKYIVLGGNMRLRALRELEWEEVPVTIYKPETPVDVLRRRVIVDNTNYGGYDFDLLANEWTEYDLEEWGIDLPDDWLQEENEIIEDEAPEVDEKEPAKSKRGEVYQLGNHRVMCGDSTDADDVAMLMNGKLADLVVTDPPYNVALQMSAEEGKIRNRRKDELGVANDEMSDKDFLLFLTDAFGVMKTNMKDGGSYYIWHADTEGYNFRKAMKDNGFVLRQNLIWVKDRIVFGRQDYQWMHEPCLYGWKDGAAHYFVDERTNRTVYEDKPDIKDMKKDELMEIVKKMWSGEYPKTTVLHEDKPNRSEEHPTMKPIKLLAKQIQNSSRLDELVLDIFLGSGSTLIAAEQTGRVCFGMELDEKYVDVIRKRYAKFISPTDELPENWEELTPAI